MLLLSTSSEYLEEIWPLEKTSWKKFKVILKQCALPHSAAAQHFLTVMQSFTYTTCVATTLHSTLKNLKANTESWTCKPLFCVYLIRILPQILCFSSSLSFMKYFEMPASWNLKKKRTWRNRRQNKVWMEDTVFFFCHFGDSQNPQGRGQESMNCATNMIKISLMKGRWLS